MVSQAEEDMATVNKTLADKIVAANGHYADSPRVVRIVEYTNAEGMQAYGMEYEWELGKYAESEYVMNPKVYWKAK